MSSTTVPQTIGFTVSSNFITSPAQIPGLGLWIDAADSNTVGLTGGSNIISVRDKSSNAYLFSNASGFTYNVVKFNGTYPSFYTPTTVTGYNLGSNTSATYTQPLTVFAVGQLASTNGVFFDGTNATNRIVIFGQSGIIFAGSQIAGTANLANNYILTTRFNTTTSFSAVYGSNYLTNVNVGGNTLASGVLLGTLYNYTFNYTGHFCELLIYRGTLTTTQQQQVEGYLAWKWGLQSNLPTSHYQQNSNIPGIVAPLPVVTQINLLPGSNFITSPAQVPGLQMWLDANDTSTLFQDSNATIPASNGSAVILWRDKSINSNHFYNTPVATNSSNPTLVSGQGVFFLPRNLSNCDIMTSSNPVAFSSSVTSIFLVIATSTNGQWLTLGNNSTDFSLRQNFSFNPNDVFFNRPTYVNGRLSTSFAAMGGNSSYFILDGVVNTLTTSNYSTRIQFNTTFLNRGARMFIQSLLIYSNVLTLTQRQQIQGWLAWNYASNNNLTQGHPYQYQSNFPGYGAVKQIPAVAPQFTFSPTTWLPNAFANLAVWFDASDSSVQRTGNVVTQWNDKSTNNVIARASNSPTIASNFLNNLNVVQLNSNSSQFFSCSNNTMNITTQDFAIFALVNIPNTQSTAIVSKGYTGAGTDRGYWLFTNFFQYRLANTVATANFTILSNNWVIISAMGYRTGSFTPAYLNGSLGGFQAFTSSQVIDNTSNFFIGRSEVGSYYNGYIAEIIGYNNTITQAQRQQVEGYLAWKWGLTSNLPIFHNSRWVPP